jgi:hypothetical protein
MDTVRPRTILRKRTDTFHSRAACHWFRLVESGQERQLLIDSVVSDVSTFRLSEQVPHDGVAHCGEEPNHQPLGWLYATHAVGQPTRQADSRPTYRLDGPQHPK